MDFGLVGLHMKGVLTSKLFPLSRNKLALESTDCLGIARP